MDTNPTIENATKTTSNEKQIQWIDPRLLLHPARLDVAVKALYANSILGKQSNNSAISPDDCYLRHILFRTGGKEPGDENRKGSLQSFQQQFIDLVLSMKTHGFMQDQPIPVASRTGIILNGAHRLAAALSLGIKQVPILLRDDIDGLGWDCNWFIMQGFHPFEIDEFTRHWVELRGPMAGCIILWSTVEAHWNQIESEIQSVTPIHYNRTIELSRDNYNELIRDIYATDWGPVPGENIERKIQFFNDHPAKLKFMVVAQSCEQTLKELKQITREKWHHIVPTDRFATLHTTDTVRETSYIANILLNRNNLHALKTRPSPQFRKAFLQWLSDYHQQLLKLQIDPQQACVVGSAVLEAYGLRQSTDIDFTLTHELRHQLFNGGVTHLNHELDVVAQDYPRCHIGDHAPTDNDLIRDRSKHIYVRGLKFANLDIVMTRKQQQRRFKDLMDVAMISKQRFESKD